MLLRVARHNVLLVSVVLHFAMPSVVAEPALLSLNTCVAQEEYMEWQPVLVVTAVTLSEDVSFPINIGIQWRAHADDPGDFMLFIGREGEEPKGLVAERTPAFGAPPLAIDYYDDTQFICAWDLNRCRSIQRTDLIAFRQQGRFHVRARLMLPDRTVVESPPIMVSVVPSRMPEPDEELKEKRLRKLFGRVHGAYHLPTMAGEGEEVGSMPKHSLTDQVATWDPEGPYLEGQMFADVMNVLGRRLQNLGCDADEMAVENRLMAELWQAFRDIYPDSQYNQAMVHGFRMSGESYDVVPGLESISDFVTNLAPPTCHHATVVRSRPGRRRSP